MATSIIDGPHYVYGNMAAILASTFGFAVADPNTDAGPNANFQGVGTLDVRYLFQKDQVVGRTGMTPIHFMAPCFRSVSQVPAAASASNIAAAANAVSGVPMVLAGLSIGVVPNVPIIPFSANINGNPPVLAMALDFGFEYGNCTAGSPVIIVASAGDFSVGMPLVIGGVGNSGGTAPLLTNVLSINAATPSITVTSAPAATNATAPIATGNIWGPSVSWSTPANMVPNSALPWLAGGPGLFLDSRQAITRAISITGAAGGSGGTFTVRGADIYGQTMTQLVTVGAGAVAGYTLKAFKYIYSVTPNFTNAFNYSVGTTDVFGFHYFAQFWDDIDVTWANGYMNTNTGFIPGVTTSPATNLTGDVRGTVQTSANGGGTGIGASASNGVVTSLVMTGRRLTMAQTIPVYESLATNPAAPQALFGQTQA